MTLGIWEGAGGLERWEVDRLVGFWGCDPSLSKFLVCRQVAWLSPHLHLPTYLDLLDLPAHIGRDCQTGLLLTQWHCELAHLAQVLGHCRDREQETFSIQGSPLPWPDAPALISPARPLPPSSVKPSMTPPCSSSLISTSPPPFLVLPKKISSLSSSSSSLNLSSAGNPLTSTLWSFIQLDTWGKTGGSGPGPSPTPLCSVHGGPLRVPGPCCSVTWMLVSTGSSRGWT